MPKRMKHLLLCTTLLCSWAGAAQPPLPARDLTVELRQVVEGREDGATHYAVGGDANPVWEPQLLQVRNGEKALLRLNDAMPMQWTQSASTQNTTGTGGAATGGSQANPQASVSNALVWFDAGQSMSVQARWPGGNKSVVLVLEVQRAAVGSGTGAVLPTQSRNTLTTTLTVPLDQWLTVAATGKAVKPGVYSSDAGVSGRRLLQVRVMAP